MSEEKKVIMIGGNDAAIAGAVIGALSEKAPEATIYELSIEEMKLITDRRFSKSESDAVKEYVEKKENRDQAKIIAEQFYRRWETQFTLGEFMSIGAAKAETQFSWSKFNEVLGTLDIFGFVEWKDAKKTNFRIIMSEEDIMNNKRREIQVALDIVHGKLLDFQNHFTTKKDKDKVASFAKKLKLTV